MAAIFGAPVTEPPGNIAASRSGRRDVRPDPAGDARHEVLDAGHGPGRHELRPRDAARLAYPAEVVAFQVHDHHVLRGVLAGCAQLVPATLGPGALDGHRGQHVAPPRQEQLRRRGHDRPAVTVHQPAVAGSQGAERPGHAPRVADERGVQVLHQVDLVDVPGRDGLPRAIDRPLVLRGASRSGATHRRGMRPGSAGAAAASASASFGRMAHASSGRRAGSGGSGSVRSGAWSGTAHSRGRRPRPGRRGGPRARRSPGRAGIDRVDRMRHQRPRAPARGQCTGDPGYCWYRSTTAAGRTCAFDGSSPAARSASRWWSRS